MSSAEPATSVYVSTSRDHPLHMWDAFSGNLRATYRAYDHLDEVVAANSVSFNTKGNKIFAGEGCQIASNFQMLEIERKLVRVYRLHGSLTASWWLKRVTLYSRRSRDRHAENGQYECVF